MGQFNRILHRLCIVFAITFGGVTMARAQAVCQNVTDTSPSIAKALKSLSSIFYRCGSMPPEPTLAEIDALNTSKAGAEGQLAIEAKFLEDAFPNNLRLQVWAGRDHDGDRVMDFRVSKSGEFRENDTDIDCDGIANVLDATPYGPVDNPVEAVCIREPARMAISADENNNGLPDHIDWRILDQGSDDPRPADIQEGLFRDYGIALVDRRARVSPAMANELNHIIRHVYKGQITADHPSLRVIAADTDVCGAGNWAWASAHSATLFIYPGTLALNPILRAEVMIHEIAHSLQFAKDYTPGHLFWLRSWNAWQTDGFNTFAKSFGWVPVRDYKQKPYNYYQLVVQNCAGPKTKGSYSPYRWTFKGEASEAWQDRWDFHKINGSQPASQNANLKGLKMIGRYAYNDAWEWHAEHTAVYALNRILDSANHFCSPSQTQNLKAWVISEMDKQSWNFNHENAKGLDVYENQIADQFQVSDGEWIGLARYFVRASNPEVCGLQPLP